MKTKKSTKLKKQSRTDWKYWQRFSKKNNMKASTGTQRAQEVTKALDSRHLGSLISTISKNNLETNIEF